ncbi:MAG: hypothetical protein LBJ75_01495 [Puniceicoccales bacterium]|jgi:hypothetical protein|nr:hypothetical protein [Puniceicoccales bacterium]
MTSQTQENAISLGGLYTVLSSKVIGKTEQDLNEALKRLEGGEQISQQELLALQTKVNVWSNMSNIASGILRAVADAMKATAQNIR